MKLKNSIEMLYSFFGSFIFLSFFLVYFDLFNIDGWVYVLSGCSVSILILRRKAYVLFNKDQKEVKKKYEKEEIK